MLAHEVVPARVLVDVIAEVHHQVEVFLGHVLIRGVQAGLEVLARRDGEAKPIDGGLRARKRARAADRAQLVARAELIPVPRVRLEAGDFDVNRMGPLWRRHRPFRIARRATGGRRSQSAIALRSAGCGMPPPFNGSIASRVQRTTLSGAGSPEHTPSVNGEVGNLGF